MSLALIASPPAGAAFWAMVAFSSSGVCVPEPVDRAAASAVRPGVVGIGLEFGVRVGRMVHSERGEDMVVDVAAPTSRR